MSVSITCEHCHSGHSYEGPDLHIALIPGGVNDSTQLLWFTCQMCGDFNSHPIAEDAAMTLTEMGARTTVVGPIPELEEPVRARGDPIPESVVRMVTNMSDASFNAVIHKKWFD